jgi:hypothetical protein
MALVYTYFPYVGQHHKVMSSIPVTVQISYSLILKTKRYFLKQKILHISRYTDSKSYPLRFDINQLEKSF